MGVGQLSESDAVDALRLPFYSSSHPTGSHGWRNQFDLGNPELMLLVGTLWVAVAALAAGQPYMVAVTALTDGKVPLGGTVMVVSKEPMESGRTSVNLTPA